MRRFTQRGLSLIEGLVVIGIALMLSAALISMYLNYNTFYGRQHGAIEVVNSASRLASKVHTAVLQASSVAAQRTISGVTYTSGTSTLVLALPTVSSSGDIVTGSTDYIVFYATGTRAYQLTDVAAGSGRPSGLLQLSNTIQSLAFSYDTGISTGATWVDVDVQNLVQARTQTAQTRVHERSYLRNQ